MDVGVLILWPLERFFDMGKYDKGAAVVHPVRQFGADERGFPFRAADPDDVLEMGAGLMGE